MGLAVFDLDNTLLAGDSDHAWGEFLILKGLADEASHRTKNDWFYNEYQAGRLDINQYVKFTLSPVLHKPLDQLKLLHQEFLQTCVRPMILPKARRLVSAHKNNGDYCLIMSATNIFITQPISEVFDVDEIMATDLVMENGYYTGEIDGIPCFQEGKLVRLNNWLELQNERYSLSNCSFYSDSQNDIPLLEAVSNPVAVDPDAELKKIAESNRWKVISLRQA